MQSQQETRSITGLDQNKEKENHRRDAADNMTDMKQNVQASGGRHTLGLHAITAAVGKHVLPLVQRLLEFSGLGHVCRQ